MMVLPTTRNVRDAVHSWQFTKTGAAAGNAVTLSTTEDRSNSLLKLNAEQVKSEFLLNFRYADAKTEEKPQRI